MDPLVVGEQQISFMVVNWRPMPSEIGSWRAVQTSTTNYFNQTYADLSLIPCLDEQTELVDERIKSELA